MKNFNLVVTMANDGRYRHLLEELEPHGEFSRTGFHGVVLGQVPSIGEFLETVRRQRQEKLIAFQDVGRIVPVESLFTFRQDEFLERLESAVIPLVLPLKPKRFYVRLERRGFKGRIVSPEVEREVDTLIVERLQEEGTEAAVDFEHPDLVIAVETIGDRCGVGLLDHELMERYDFVRVR